MNILYVITILALYILFMLLHKKEKKQNFIEWLIISTIIILCYNIFICLIHSFIDIKSTLLNLSITNLIVSIVLLAIIIKSKKIQKYYIKILDIVVLILFLIIVTFIAYKQYEIPFKIKYVTTDGSTHYYYADQFYKTSELLYKGEDNDIFGLHNSDFRLPGAYVNEGILFKIFDDVVLKVDLFIIFDLFILYLSGIAFYYLLKNCICKINKKLELLAIIFALIYMFTYQLSSMLYGFVYLSLALCIIVGFFLLMQKYEKRELSAKVALPILALLSFGIFFSYAYFIPVIYIAVIVNIIIKSVRENDKIFSERNLYEIMFIIINPLILGITFFVILPLASDIKNEISTLGLEGVNYENYITNLLAFIPILIGGIIILFKNENKQIKFPIILLVVTILFIAILFVGNKIEKVSEYYCFKAYYILWPLVLYNAFIMIVDLTEQNKILKIGTYTYISIYIIAIIISTFIIKTDIGINHIYKFNVETMESKDDIMQRGELEIFKRVKTTLNNGQIYLLNSKMNGKVRWMSVLYDKNFIFLDTINGYEITINEWLEKRDKKYYIAYYLDYQDTAEKEPNLDENSEDYKILYNDEHGFILERLKEKSAT